VHFLSFFQAEQKAVSSASAGDVAGVVAGSSGESKHGLHRNQGN